MSIATFDRDPAAVSLCEWLAGQWAILFSNPEDFAPHPSTPAGFHAQIAGQFEELRVKPLALAVSTSEPGHQWLRDIDGASASIRLAGTNAGGATVIDFIGCALESKLRNIETPYVAVLDELGRCRLTIRYLRYRTDRPRTVDELLRMVKVLRGDVKEVSRPSCSACFASA